MKNILAVLLLLVPAAFAQKQEIPLPSSKLLLAPAPGSPQRLDSLPTTAVLSPDRRYLAILNGGFGTMEGDYRQGISVLDLTTNKVSFFPDDRLGKSARQTYFLGLAFSADGSRLYASIASLTDPEGKQPGSTGNGIAVYRFDAGRVTPERFLSIPPQPVAAGKRRARAMHAAPPNTLVPFPAGLTVVASPAGEQLVVADNLSDDVLLLSAADGKILRRFDLSTHDWIPAAYPYTVVVSRDGRRAWCSLWNASRVAELDLINGGVTRWIPLHPPKTRTDPGSHPSALLLRPDERQLYVALANTDEVAVVNPADGKVIRYLSTRLGGEGLFGAVPNALALSDDGRRLYVANASNDSVAVFDILAPRAQRTRPNLATLPPGAGCSDCPADVKNTIAFGAPHPADALGFIPTEWYPTALAVRGDELFIVAGKAQGTGPNSATIQEPGRTHPYIAALVHGSVARVNLPEAQRRLPQLTQEVSQSNLMNGRTGAISFHDGTRCAAPVEVARGGAGIRAGIPGVQGSVSKPVTGAASCRIKHVVYIIKENRTYDQVFGDLPIGDNDKSLIMYGADVSPNHHQLALQFGVYDNFYDSGEVSGDGHVWSNAAIVSDFTEKIWQIAYRGKERLYDFEGRVMDETPLEQDMSDVNEPGSGYLWANAARHKLTYRNYGEFAPTTWCRDARPPASPQEGPPSPQPAACTRNYVKQGEPLPAVLGGGPSPWPWAVPLPAFNSPTKVELRGHFNPDFPWFNLDYPDQFRADIFLSEFHGWVRDRQQGRDTMPNLITMSLSNDHTGGTRPGFARPAASVADNDLALGRIVEAISHSPYWDDTAIFVLEDDAQNGADHVDAHRSLALVISKYAPTAPAPFLDHHFYTTVNMIRTMEVLLGLPPMNSNDAHAALMAPGFSGARPQPPFTADYRNRDNGFIYAVNPPKAPGAQTSMKMDFSRPDAVNSAVLNRILWRDAKGRAPEPKPRHTVIPTRTRDGDGD